MGRQKGRKVEKVALYPRKTAGPTLCPGLALRFVLLLGLLLPVLTLRRKWIGSGLNPNNANLTRCHRWPFDKNRRPWQMKEDFSKPVPSLFNQAHLKRTPTLAAVGPKHHGAMSLFLRPQPHLVAPAWHRTPQEMHAFDGIRQGIEDRSMAVDPIESQLRSRLAFDTILIQIRSIGPVS